MQFACSGFTPQVFLPDPLLSLLLLVNTCAVYEVTVKMMSILF